MATGGSGIRIAARGGGTSGSITSAFHWTTPSADSVESIPNRPAVTQRSRISRGSRGWRSYGGTGETSSMNRILLAAVLLVGCASPPESVPAPAPGPEFVLLTYNVNYGLAGDGATVAAIRGSGADLVLLQETNPAWEAALAGLRDEYPYQEYVHRGAAGGMAVLSRRPFETRRVLEPPPGGWFPALLVRAETPLGPVEALDVHLRPQLGEDGGVVSGFLETPPIRVAEIERYLDALDPAVPRILAGDFNEQPGSAALEAAAERGFLRVGIDEDTWHWETSLVTLRRSFDHVLHDARLAPIEGRVLEAGRSDHWPVRVRFGRAAGAADPEEDRTSRPSS